ncbi:MAG: type I-E CRISPR-associated protein Cas5/CasD [Acidobacteria bacterium]|nr:type I-E CRISPR-associated protein Cas5/CasD [Acidobacteriota bacterium]
MSEQVYLALMLDAPLMSWGFASRFQRRSTALHPTRSGILGMICAALGVSKGSRAEEDWLARLEPTSLTVFAIPRRPEGCVRPLEIRRLEDYHTTGGGYDKKTHALWIPRKASGGPSDNATLSSRQYLLDARFGVILSGLRSTLEPVGEALCNPRWGIWFGRKSCLPAAPVLRGGGVVVTSDQALVALGLADRNLAEFARVDEAASFADGTDTLMDAPVNFLTREFKPRRIRQQVPELSEG